jgi:hypothetical protein
MGWPSIKQLQVGAGDSTPRHLLRELKHVGICKFKNNKAVFKVM